MEKEKLVIEVLKNMQGKYRHYIGILDYTKEISNALSIGDNVSTSILLELRKDEMLKVDEYEEGIQRVLESLSEEEQIKIRKWMKGVGGSTESKEQELLLQLVEKIKSTLQQIVMLDKRMNVKITGTSSFYK